MEDNLKKNENGRRPQFFLKNQIDDLKKMEDDHKKNEKNGRQPQFF